MDNLENGKYGMIWKSLLPLAKGRQTNTTQKQYQNMNKYLEIEEMNNWSVQVLHKCMSPKFCPPSRHT